MSAILSPLAQAVADLHARLVELRQRPDIVFVTDEVGAPAPAELLAPYRAQPEQWPAELLDFYALLNGIRVEWNFAGGAKGGYLDIPPLTATGYAETVQWKTSHRVRRTALLLTRDRSLAGWGAWLVGEPDTWANSRLVYGTLESAMFDGPVAPSLPDFLRRTAAAYLAEDALTNDDHRAEVLRKLDSPGRPVQPVGVGSRVVLNLEMSKVLTPDYRRAEVLQLQAVPPGSALARDLRPDQPPTYALLQLDQGAKMAWWPLEQLTAAPNDLYEHYYAAPEALLDLGHTAGWEAVLRVLAQLAGPNAGWSNDFNKGADGIAALLTPLPLTEAFTLVLHLLEGLHSAQDQLPQMITLDEEEQQQVTQREQWVKHARDGDWQMYMESLLHILLSGAKLRLLYEPAPARRKLPVALINRLEAAYWPAQFSWWSTKDFFNKMRKLRLNNLPRIREPYLSLGYDHDDLPGDYPVRYELSF
jgi:hypothetical protein